MPMCNLLDDGQSRAGAVHLASHGALEQVENPLGLVRFNPDPAVRHREAD